MHYSLTLNAFTHIKAAFVNKKSANAIYSRTLIKKTHLEESLPSPSKNAKHPQAKPAPFIKSATANKILIYVNKKKDR